MIKGVIFDADGTLLDSMGFWTSTVYDIIEKAGIRSPDPGLIEILTPMSMYEGAVYLRDNYGLEEPVEEIIEKENRLVLNFYNTQVRLTDGISELLDRLTERGIPMAVATATERSMIESALRHTGILDRFVGVISCSDVGQGKDSPLIFYRACELLGTAPNDTAVVDDSPTALETALKAGFTAIDAADCVRLLTALREL